MATVSLGGAETIGFEPRRNVVRLYPGVDGARIALEYSVSSTGPNPAVSNRPFEVAADVAVSRLANQNERFLCRLFGEHVVTPTPNGAQLTLAGFISAGQLRQIEQMRAGGNFVLGLTLHVSTVADGMLQTYRGDEHLPMPSGEWASQLDQVEAATFVEVLVPMPVDAAYATAVRRLREARELLRSNDIDAAMGKARLALEPVREALDAVNVMAAAAPKARDRNQAERTAFVIEATYSLLSAAQHDDELTKTFRFTRADAAMTIAVVAGLLGKVTEQVGP